MSQIQKLVPDQKKGARTGATNTRETPTRHEAILLFREAKKRLLDVNQWHKLCGKASAVFRITDAEGNLLNTDQPKVGNLIRIELPAPPNKSGSGYDWVRIEEFLDESDLIRDEDNFGFRVRPVPNPLDPDDRSAHFYTNDATSTFLITRSTNHVTAMERGRNEKPNTGAAGLLNKVRNAVIALSAMLGLSTPQWKSLVNGIINGGKK